MTYVSNCGSEEVNNVLVWHCDDALPVNLNNPMIDANATAFGYSTTQEAANDAILDAETELEFLVGSANEHLDYGWAVDDDKLHSRLALGRLQGKVKKRMRSVGVYCL